MGLVKFNKGKSSGLSAESFIPLPEQFYITTDKGKLFLCTDSGYLMPIGKNRVPVDTEWEEPENNYRIITLTADEGGDVIQFKITSGQTYEQMSILTSGYTAGIENIYDTTYYQIVGNGSTFVIKCDGSYKCPTDVVADTTLELIKQITLPAPQYSIVGDQVYFTNSTETKYKYDAILMYDIGVTEPYNTWLFGEDSSEAGVIIPKSSFHCGTNRLYYRSQDRVKYHNAEFTDYEQSHNYSRDSVGSISNDNYHSVRYVCQNCGDYYNAEESHTWDSDGLCIVCGGSCTHSEGTYTEFAYANNNGTHTMMEICSNCHATVAYETQACDRDDYDQPCRVCGEYAKKTIYIDGIEYTIEYNWTWSDISTNNYISGISIMEDYVWYSGNKLTYSTTGDYVDYDDSITDGTDYSTESFEDDTLPYIYLEDDTSSFRLDMNSEYLSWSEYIYTEYPESFNVNDAGYVTYEGYLIYHNGSQVYVNDSIDFGSTYTYGESSSSTCTCTGSGDETEYTCIHCGNTIREYHTTSCPAYGICPDCNEPYNESNDNICPYCDGTLYTCLNCGNTYCENGYCENYPGDEWYNECTERDRFCSESCQATYYS